jgi:hypothetical protein
MKMSGAPLSAQEYRKQLTSGVVARNDFSATDTDYFANNGRLVRLRPPLASEFPKTVHSLEALNYTPFVIVVRTSPAYAAAPVALIATKESLSMSLPLELARMGDDLILALLDKKEVKWWPVGVAQ